MSKSFFILSFILLINIFYGNVDMYPFDHTTFDDRQDAILDSLRRDMHIDYKKEVIFNQPYLLENNNKNKNKYNILHNLENLPFELHNNRYSKNKQFNTKDDLMYKKKDLDELLNKACGYYNKDYWSFEWCHRKEVRQVHIELINHIVVRDPDWSLG